MKSKHILALALVAATLQGCAALGLTLASAGVGVVADAGVDHTINGIVYKTFPASENKVRFAALKALDRMGMPVTADDKTEAGWKISATAADRTIDVELERLTGETTRMRVVANEGAIFFKDAATATAIVMQTSHALDDEQKAAESAGNRKRKPT